MTVKRTNKQLQAIAFNEGNCLVAAGAGSGKTSVLTQRIFELVVSGKAKLSEFLVLTFTNKAAHEMKMRVRDLFLEKEEYAHLVPQVEVAKIMTFDAFALDLVKRYSHQLGLEKGIDLIDECFFTIEAEKILEEILAGYYHRALEGKEPVFLSLIKATCERDDDGLRAFIQAIRGLADKKTDRAAFYRDYADQAFSDRQVKNLFAEFEDYLRSLLKHYYDAASLADDSEGYFTKDLELLSVMLNTSSFDQLMEAIPDWPTKRTKDAELKALRGFLKEEYLDPVRKKIPRKTQAQWIAEYKANEPYVRLLVDIARQVDERLDDYKKAHGVYSFADIASLARRIVEGEYGPEVRQGFRYVMIDEYQDTNDLQESFIGALQVPNVFLVGDIKQSIYGFRNANPSLFVKKFAAYQKGRGGTLITLEHNFRSRKQVLDSINKTFGSIMTEEAGGIDYGNGQALEFGNHSYDATENAAPYGYEVLDYEKLRCRNAERVGDIMAKDILAKIAQRYQVSGKNGTSRDIRYGDFAVLCRGAKDFETYERVFRSYNIPVLVAKDGKAFANDILIAMQSLIEWIDMEANDVNDDARLRHLYASLRRSFLFQMSDRELFVALKGDGYLTDGLRGSIREFALAHKQSTIQETVESAIVAFGFVDKLPELREVKANFDCLTYFVSLAKMASSLGMNLHDFVLFLRKRAELELDLDLPSKAESENAVTIMTMHKSKGLEFPFVYFPSLNGQFQTVRGIVKGFHVSDRYGLVIPGIDNENADSFAHVLHLADYKAQNISEEMRLLYVALTRAKESYCVLYPILDGNQPKAVFSIRKARSHLAFLQLSPFFDCPHRKAEHLPRPEWRLGEGLKTAAVSFASPLPAYVPASQEKAKMAIPAVPNYGALRFGRRLHRALEVVDLSIRDLSFLENDSERKHLEKVLSLPVFNEGGKAFREYAYLDEEGKQHRVDLFFLHEDHITVVDYKSANLDHPEYIAQVQGYCAYLEEVFHLPSEGYLLSLSEARLVKVK